jgi:uncharacterized protein
MVTARHGRCSKGGKTRKKELAMQLTPKTRIADLIKTYPFLLDYLAGYAPEFQKLRNPVLRNTVGRVATLGMAAGMGHIDLPRLLADLRTTIKQQSGEEIEVEGAEAVPRDRAEVLKGIIRDLHDGIPVDEAKRRFAALVEDVDPSEIAHMEQQLMAEGLPSTEIRRLCDVHVQVFKESLDRQAGAELPDGHPVQVFLAENRELEAEVRRANELVTKLADRPQPELGIALARSIERLGEVERHYQRKENQLFPFLERQGIVGPPQVMWAIHDEVRALLKQARSAVAEHDLVRLAECLPTLTQKLADMAYKENNILFPLSLQVLEEKDWSEIRAGEESIGYAFGQQPAPVPRAAVNDGDGAATTASGARLLPLDTGLLTLEQVNLMLRALPVDVSFVDENDEVRYYSEGRERIFPRSPAVIGRKVQNCHPPKSLETVNRILREFRQGRKDAAEFWISLGGRFVHIRYVALRDGAGRYRGTLEVTQDVTAIRLLEGQRRLLDWDSEGSDEEARA